MNGFLLTLLLPLAHAAEGRKAAEPLPAKPAEEEYRVVVDESAEPKETESAPEPARPGVRRRGVGRLASVDLKGRRVVVEDEDGEELSLAVPDGARLSFAAEERPLSLEQLRRGDSVSFSADGGKATRLHLDLCGGGQDDDDFFAPPRPKHGRPMRRQPVPDDDDREHPQADEPDVPMYQSEPPEPPPAPKKAPKKG
ncbi:MAG: hypothetical protein FD126_2619 [Elusimicrobia bacterium]|nr:MAG: hypothetical protein FD126_2619 [Elusimicrobiota bacterium]